MKRLFLLLGIVALVTTTSCTGPEGPQGATGYSAESEVFEVTTSFNAGNNFTTTFPLNPFILPSDNILVYELSNTNDGIDTWALLPQVYYFGNTGASAQYNFDFSYDQFSIFIDASFDMTTLPASFTQGKTFRVVIIPGYASKSAVNNVTVDTSDYNAVIQAYHIDDSNVKRIN